MPNCPLCGSLMNSMGGAGLPASTDPLAGVPDEPQAVPLGALRANPGQLFGSMRPIAGPIPPQQFFGGGPSVSGADLKKLFGY